MPLYGHELTTALTPFDAGLGRVVKFEKEGDFVGPRRRWQAAAERADAEPAAHAGRPGRRGPPGPARRVPGRRRTAQVIGEVTSGAPSPTLGKPIAMAYVDAAHAAPGTAGVGVDIRGTPRAVRGRGAAVLQARRSDVLHAARHARARAPVRRPSPCKTTVHQHSPAYRRIRP